MNIRNLFIAVLLVGAMHPAVSRGQQNVEIVWEDDFDAHEREKLVRWLDACFANVSEHIGPYRFETILYVHRSERGGEPVPWANTVRHGEQGVRFYVDPSFTLEAFQRDWTAPHEMAHLSLPFIGREHMWFAEGYASFMQWYLLEKQGLFGTDEVRRKYKQRIERAMLRLNSDQPFPELCAQLLKRHDYPSIYWGGSLFFFAVDQALKSKYNTDLFSVISRYQINGRMDDRTLEQLLVSLDALVGSTPFQNMLERFTTLPASQIIEEFKIH